MKKSYKIIMSILGIVSVFMLFLSITSLRSASSVGIIGSADGPTSILVSAIPTIYILLGVGAVITILAFIVICIVVLKKK